MAHLLQRVSKVCIHDITWSDHAPIALDIVDSHKGSNIALWCNNTFLLSHPQHRPELEGKIKEFYHS